MNFKLIIWMYVVFVTTQTEGMQHRKENQILVEDRDICDGFPQIKCSNDCSSLKVCYDEKMSPITLKCPANRPFCANGKCETENESCQIQLKDDVDAQDFVCTADGIFPDPINCTNWYVCDGATVTQGSCTAGYIFNSKTNGCVRGTPRIDHASKSICRKISCNKKPNGYILFPANPAYYAYCSNGSMLLYRCDDVENQIYDISSKRCVFNCRAAGYFPDPSDCTDYYYCKGYTNKFKATTLYCAEGHYFDGTNCVIGMNCGTTTTSPTIPTPPTPTTKDPTSVPTPPTATTESTTFTSIPFPTTEGGTTTTEVPTSTSVSTPPTTDEPTSISTPPTASTSTSVPFPTTEEDTTTTEVPTSVSTPPTPTTELPTSISTPPTPTTGPTPSTSITFPTTESTTVSTTTVRATPPIASTTSTVPPTTTVSTTTVRATPPIASTTSTVPPPPTAATSTSSSSIPSSSPFSLSTMISYDSLPASAVLDFHSPIDQRKTTKLPSFYQSYSLWKHKGKYSIRLF